MRIAITTTQVPFAHGGAELMTNQLSRVFREKGHQVDVISIPFVFSSKDAIRDNMDDWEKQDLNRIDAGQVDKVISLKFPTYYLQHPNKTIWLMHQHRSVYDLWDTPFGDSSTDKTACDLRDDIIRRDTKFLAQPKRIFTISKNVGRRLKKYNNIDSEHLYQPSPLSDVLEPGDQNSYIFCPGRLEGLKRQELLIRAAAKCKTSCNILIAGSGSLATYLRELCEELNTENKVRLLGHVSESELVQLYRNSLGVFFAPVDEDYGFVTLEAMQSGKPVITCVDSGGPLEFIADGETGFIVEPEPQQVADRIDSLYQDRKYAKKIGMNAFDAYNSLGLSWDNVVPKLLDEHAVPKATQQKAEQKNRQLDAQIEKAAAAEVLQDVLLSDKDRQIEHLETKVEELKVKSTRQIEHLETKVKELKVKPTRQIEHLETKVEELNVESTRQKELLQKKKIKLRAANSSLRKSKLLLGDKEKELQIITARYEVSKQRIEKLEKEIRSTHAALVHWDWLYRDSQNELEESNESNLQLRKQLEIAAQRISQLQHSLHLESTESERLAVELEAVYASKSWKVTWPIRALIDVLKWSLTFPARVLFKSKQTADEGHSESIPADLNQSEGPAQLQEAGEYQIDSEPTKAAIEGNIELFIERIYSEIEQRHKSAEIPDHGSNK